MGKNETAYSQPAKPDTAFSAAAPAETAFAAATKQDTDYDGNPDYEATLYDADQVYDFDLVYNGLGRGLATLLPKPDTGYAGISKVDTSYIDRTETDVDTYNDNTISYNDSSVFYIGYDPALATVAKNTTEHTKTTKVGTAFGSPTKPETAYA